MPRVAVVLFNLGGPDRPEAVRPFLINLFSDPAIIALPAPFRQLVARLIAWRRDAVARDIYARLGGGSPLLAQTRAQANALAAALNRSHPTRTPPHRGEGKEESPPPCGEGKGGGDLGISEVAGGIEARVFIAMRYWHPLTRETVAEVAAWRPERIVLLPLYPQHSSTSTASSLAAWERECRRAGLSVPSSAISRYPTLPGMIAAQAELIAAALARAGTGVRLLFSAHGLPKRIVARGDTYPDEVMITARAIVETLAVPGLDWRVCYQSRVGPLEWIGPYTDDEIRRAGAEGKALVVVPVAFVSEHSETLVELDMDYKRVADAAGVRTYIRVPTLGTHPDFIAGLAELVRATHPQGS